MCPEQRSVVQPLALIVLLVAGQAAPRTPVKAVWADEVETAASSEREVFRPVPAPAAVWADEVETGAEVRVQSRHQIRDHLNTVQIK